MTRAKILTLALLIIAVTAALAAARSPSKRLPELPPTQLPPPELPPTQLPELPPVYVYAYPELLSSAEWTRARAAFEAASSLTGRRFEVITDFTLRGDGVAITPWARDADASMFSGPSAAVAFTMCAHGALLPGSIRCPSSYDSCAAIAAEAAISAWGAWRPAALVAITHASTERWQSVAADFASRTCGATDLKVTTDVESARRIVASGEHESYGLLVFGSEAIGPVLEKRAWLLSRNCKCVYFGEVDEARAAALRDAAVPFAEHRVYSDCFTAFCFALNVRELRRHRPLPARENAPAAARPEGWRAVGVVIVARGRDISAWDRYGSRSPGDLTSYYDWRGQSCERAVEGTTERGELSGGFVRLRLSERPCADKSGLRAYAVHAPDVHPLPPLPPLRTGDVVELPGTLEHAQVLLF